jgi:hypothetical protein
MDQEQSGESSAPQRIAHRIGAGDKATAYEAEREVTP